MATPAQPRAADAPPTPVAALRAALKAGREALRESFLAKPDTPKLLREHARLVDTAIRGAWRESRMPSSRSAATAAANCTPAPTSTCSC